MDLLFWADDSMVESGGSVAFWVISEAFQLQGSSIYEVVYPFLPLDFKRRCGAAAVNYLTGDIETIAASLYIGIFTVDFIINAVFWIAGHKEGSTNSCCGSHVISLYFRAFA